MGRNLYVGMGISALGWSLPLLAFGSVVARSFQHGHGISIVAMIAVAVPLAGLIVAVPALVLLHRIGHTVAARAVAIWALGALPLGFILMIML
jgi:hypothetical protein